MRLWGVKRKGRRHEDLGGLALLCAWTMLSTICVSQYMRLLRGQEEPIVAGVTSAAAAAAAASAAAATESRHNPRLLLIVIPLVGRRHPRGVQVFIERLVVHNWGLVAAELLRLWPSSSNGSTSLALPVVRVYGVVAHGEACDPQLGENSHGPQADVFECIVLNGHCGVPGFEDIPTVNCIFDTIHAKLASLGQLSAAAAQQPWVALANSDILFSPVELASILATVMADSVDRSLVKSGVDSEMLPALGSAVEENNLVLVGQRIDVPVASESLERVVHSRSGFELFAQTVHRDGSLHPDFGIDYFIFPARLLPRAFPPFLIGRFRWDNALLARYILSTTVATVDITSVATALHLGDAFSSDPSYHGARRGADYNDRLAEQHLHQAYALGRIHNSDLILRRRQDGGAAQGYRLDARPAQVDSDVLTAWRRASHEASIEGNGTKTGAHPFVLLVPVLPHDWARVRFWMDRGGPVASSGTTPAPRWLHRRSLLVTTDRATYAILDALYPGAVLLEAQTVGPAGWSLAHRWKTFNRLLGVGMAVAVARIDDLALPSSDMDRVTNLWQCCHVTRFNGDIRSVQPTAIGLEYYYNHHRARRKGCRWIEIVGTGWACLYGTKKVI